MSYLIDDSVWDSYKAIIDGVHDDFNQETITWKRNLGNIDKNGEDNDTARFSSISLKGLIQFNNTRVWPLTRFTDAGALDLQSQVLWLNMTYLKNAGYINSNGNFDYDQMADTFTHRGIEYSPVGDTMLSQAKDTPLLFMIILNRITIESESPDK